MADARKKILPEEKILIINLITEEGWTKYKTAKVFGISRRSIDFILDPDKLKKNREQAKKGGYYTHRDKKKASVYASESRKKKREQEKGHERLKTFEVRAIHQEDTKVYRRRVKKRSKREAESFLRQHGFIVKSIKQVSKDEQQD
jgi:hypothetical protein